MALLLRPFSAVSMLVLAMCCSSRPALAAVGTSTDGPQGPSCTKSPAQDSSPTKATNPPDSNPCPGIVYADPSPCDSYDGPAYIYAGVVHTYPTIDPQYRGNGKDAYFGIWHEPPELAWTRHRPSRSSCAACPTTGAR